MHAKYIHNRVMSLTLRGYSLSDGTIPTNTIFKVMQKETILNKKGKKKLIQSIQPIISLELFTILL